MADAPDVSLEMVRDFHEHATQLYNLASNARLSPGLLYEIKGHIQNRLVGHMPTALEIPAKDREFVLAFLDPAFSAHLAKHWPEGTDITLHHEGADAPGGRCVPLLMKCV